MLKTITKVLIFLFLASSLFAIDFPDIKGFAPEGDVLTYNPENLYEYIDGAADAFVAYGFQTLSTCDLNFDSLKFTVDLYDMGSRINAFGMYKTERPSDAKGLKIGVEAVVSPPFQCLLLKDAYYVKINIFEGNFDIENGAKVLTAIAAALPGSEELPGELQLLPVTNRISNSESYNRESFLGLTALTRCVYASYLENGIKFRYFVRLASKERSNEEVWEQLGRQWQTVEIDGKTVLYKKIPYKGITGIIKIEDKLMGVADCETIDQMKLLLNQLN